MPTYPWACYLYGSFAKTTRSIFTVFTFHSISGSAAPADILPKLMPVTLVKSDPKAREKPCLRCGYSLRKLLDAKHCPECGLSMWLSLNANDSLDWSNPSWLRRLAFGGIILAPVQILGFLVYASV